MGNTSLNIKKLNAATELDLSERYPDNQVL